MIMKKFVFPDTSIFLNFHPLDQLDLAVILSCDSVELVLPPTILEELERLGWDHAQLSMRKRAQYNLRKIRGWMQSSDGLIRENVELTLSQAPKQTAFREHHLDSRNRDDIFLASVLDYRRIHGNDAVVLLTHDMRRKLKAHRFNLNVLSLPQEAQLPPVRETAAPDEAQAPDAPGAARGRVPQVRLRFANGSRVTDVRQRDEDILTAETIKARMDELRLWCREPLQFRDARVVPGTDDREATSMLVNALMVPEEEFRRYEHEVDIFLRDCEAWLTSRAKVRDLLSRTVRLDLELINPGGAVAEGLVLSLSLPKKLSWHESLGDEGLPDRPQLPQPPRTHMELVRQSLDELYEATVPPWSVGLETVQVPVSENWLVEGQELRGLVDACPQLGTVSLEPIYARFVSAEEIANFAVSYVINQHNVTEPIDGRLLVRVG